MKPRTGEGFTLLEILVALAIFAVVSITIYGRIGDVVLQTGSLEARTFATWAAQDALTRMRLEQVPGEAVAVGRNVASVNMANRQLELVTEVSAAGNGGWRRVEIEVYELAAGSGERGASPVARLRGFLGQH